MTPNMTGALLMMASMASFTLNDAMIKLTGGAVPLMQLLFLRGVLSSLLILVLAQRLGAIHFRIASRDWWLIAIRSGAEVGAAYFFLTALFNMPLANVTAILQVLPLTVAIGAALFFREPLGWRRMSAIMIGFMGMLLIVRPGPEGFSLWSGYALMAVVFVTMRDLATRRLSPDVPSMTVTFLAALTVMGCAGLASIAEPWAPLDLRLTALITASSVFIIGGYWFSVRVMRVGDISFIAPFRYTGLVWALLLGWLVFGDWPSNLTLMGATIVVATGLFTLYRERRVSQN
ncbi:DMT family transporter [Tateyamaria sp. Alg231-49]|uniref:DMT family transporter n=1 Tax=Tateyamaria sp. Alg231-49 TaxID=1922219 RepID=UPI001901EE12|nr:DMT family transporter [Tateyamaria sp. Alg231-49]